MGFKGDLKERSILGNIIQKGNQRCYTPFKRTSHVILSTAKSLTPPTVILRELSDRRISEGRSS
jgi:hypothetical protein